MENKAHALIAGLFTLVMLAAAILAAAWLNRDRTEWVPYQIATKLSIPGLNPQAAVRYRGLDVGKVDSITFDPDAAGQLLIRISVRPDTPITRSTFAMLGYQGVTGIAYVELEDDGSQPTRLHSSPQQMARIEMRPSLFDQLQERGLAILQQTEEVTRRINTLLSDRNQKAIVDTFDNLNRAAGELATIPRQLQPTLAKLPGLATQAQRTLGSVDALARDASALAGKLNGMATQLQAQNGPIDRIADAADRFGQASSRFEYEILPLAREVRSTMRSLNRTLDNLNERPQSVLFGTPTAVPGPGEPGFEKR
jgi:phospholipid/cholesterol/gamma-HCH transport system substrate-binding protein